MSRARPIRYEEEILWIDTKRNGQKATARQLELLATIETNCELDDLLDQSLTQGEVVERLRQALGHGIPDGVLEKIKRWREDRHQQPQCRICKKEGDSTKHHFVNKWILRELTNYQQKWAQRSQNCIPVCIECHRDLHSRDNGPRSIAEHLNAEEREFAERALSALSEERPKLLILLARGDDSVYESRLVKDWIVGAFSEEPKALVTATELRKAA